MSSDNKKTAVFGIYFTRDGVERATDALLQSGFTTNDISVLLPESLSGSRPVVTNINTSLAGSAVGTPTHVTETGGQKDIGTVKNTKAPEGATVGASTGAVIGGTLGLLAGIGALAIPGVGPLIAAGPIMAALAGIGGGGAVGGFTGALIGMGIPEYEAKKYEGRLKKGGILFNGRELCEGRYLDHSRPRRCASRSGRRNGTELIVGKYEKGEGRFPANPSPCFL